MRNPFKRSSDPVKESSYSGMIRSSRSRHRKHMRHWWQWAAVGVAVAVIAAGAGGTYLYYHEQAKVQVGVGGVSPPPTDANGNAQPFNALLVGSDSRTGLTPAQQLKLGANAVGGQRSDTIIIAHVDPATDHVTMIQFPRDLYVPIASGGKDKINASFENGRSNLVKTVEDLTGLSINHYAEVNLAGFRDIVNAVGGVDICITQAIPFDSHTGLSVPKPGMIHFNGNDALRFVRAREVFATGDFARIQNQQKFLAAALHKVTSVSTFFHFSRVKQLLDVAGKNVRIDKGTTLKGLYDLLKRFRTFNPQDYEAYTAPNLGSKTITLSSGAPSDIVVPDFPAMHVMFKAIADNTSPADADGVPSIDPSTIRVGVYNGVSLAKTVAGPASDALKAATTTAASSGVNVVDVANAKHFHYKQSVITYDPSKPETKNMAELVAAAVPGAVVKAGKTGRGVDVAVVVGKRFKTKHIVQILPIPITQPQAPPPVCQHPGQLGSPTGG